MSVKCNSILGVSFVILITYDIDVIYKCISGYNLVFNLLND